MLGWMNKTVKTINDNKTGLDKWSCIRISGVGIPLMTPDNKESEARAARSQTKG